MKMKMHVLKWRECNSRRELCRAWHQTWRSTFILVGKLINTSLLPKKLVTPGNANSFTWRDGDTFRGIEVPARNSPRGCHCRIIGIRAAIRRAKAACEDKGQAWRNYVVSRNKTSSSI